MGRVTCDRPHSLRVAGVQFRDGEAETDNPGALAYFRRRSDYTVEAPPSRRRRAPKPKTDTTAGQPADDTVDGDQ